MTTTAPASIFLALSHPAPLDKEVARSLPIEERGWYLDVWTSPSQTTPATEKLSAPAWEPLRRAVVALPAGAFRVLLRAGPPKGPRSVRAGFALSPRGVWVGNGPGAARGVCDVAGKREVAAVYGGVPRSTVPVPADPPRGTGTVELTGTSETVSQIALDRVTEDAAHLRAQGIAVPPVLRVLGGRVNATGVANFAISHQRHEERPLTIDALEEVRAEVRREYREDVSVPRERIRLTPTGVELPGVGVIALEEAGLRGIATLFGDTLPSATPLLLQLPPTERAELANRQIERSERRGTVRVRTRLVNGARQAYAVVGDGYAARDADVLAADMIAALRGTPGGREARGEVVYRPETAAISASALWHADHVVDLACGDIFREGVELRSSDNGGGSIQVWALQDRNLCYNLIYLGRGGAAVARVQHRGDHRGLTSRLSTGLRAALRIGERFRSRWGYARATSAAEALAELRGARLVTLADGREVTLREAFAEAKTPEAAARTAYEAILDLDHLDLPRRTDATVELLLSGWRHEPGQTLADLVNGVTRVHEAAIPVDTRVRFETAAGRLLLG